MTDVAPASGNASGGDGGNGGGRVKVGGYTRSDGTKVSDHKRSAPGAQPASKSDDNPGQEVEEEEGKQQPPPKKMTIDEYLNQPWVDKIAHQIGTDPEKAALANGDAQAEKNRVARETAIADAQAEKAKGGFNAFRTALLKEMRSKGYSENEPVPDHLHAASEILRRLDEGMYHDEGSMQKRSLVPHLGDAGLHSLAVQVMNMKYKF